MLNQLYRVGGTCPNFMEKTFTDGSETVKFVNVFSFKNFCYNNKYVCLMSQSWDNAASMHNHPLTVHVHKTEA